MTARSSETFVEFPGVVSLSSVSCKISSYYIIAPVNNEMKTHLSAFFQPLYIVTGDGNKNITWNLKYQHQLLITDGKKINKFTCVSPIGAWLFL